jgi:hypothetical protein
MAKLKIVPSKNKGIVQFKKPHWGFYALLSISLLLNAGLTTYMYNVEFKELIDTLILKLR